MWLVNFNHLITEYLNYPFIISYTLICKLFITEISIMSAREKPFYLLKGIVYYTQCIIYIVCFHSLFNSLCASSPKKKKKKKLTMCYNHYPLFNTQVDAIMLSSLLAYWLGPRLSKSGSYIGSWEVGEIVDRRIGSWIVRSYIIWEKYKKYILVY